jgi:ADP-ribose pyrophosphatase
MLRAGADREEKKADSKMIFRGKIINLRLDEVILPDGGRAAREVIEHSGAVVVIPVLNNGNILFVKQYRYPVSDFLLELPAGKLDRGGEEITECARRELLEETHYSCGRIEKLLEFYTSPGFCDEKLHLLVATGLKHEAHPDIACDEDEFISIADFSPDEAVKMISDNKISDAKTILGILYYNSLVRHNNGSYNNKDNNNLIN